MKKEEIIKMEQEEHRRYHRMLIYVFIIMMIVLFGGATFYHYAEGWKYLDAIYFSASTITTVGYGDITPKTDVGKIFTIFYLFTGVGIAVYGLSLMASHFVEIREEFWLQRLGNLRIKYHTETFWEKLKNAFNYSSDKIINEYEHSNKKKK